VIAFIYADLIIIPIVIAYRKYYGGAVTARLVAIMFAAMVVTALAVDGLFSLAGLVPEKHPTIDSIASRGISWNYTTVLNILFLVLAVALGALTLRRGARDPVCGMTVDRSKALKREFRGRTYYFCGPGCKAKFEAAPEGYLESKVGAEPPLAHVGHGPHD
jgi:YHS domain-containing protein